MIQKIIDFFFGKRIDGKEQINREMSDKYGKDWLEQLEGNNKD